ncbi:hypothetical protein BX600DRAFT_462666 [Xylariales sp. PMI_506]|nr:hypothetical protein BX600DRAFT_462666 [Xylariales sp. PMI_506]
MYGTTKQSINLFQFPNTLVGDATVTIILQCIITWMIELILVNQDLRKGRIQSIGTVSEPKNAAVRWFMFMDRGEETCKRGSFKHWVLFLYSQILRGFMISVVCFALLIGPVIGFLILVGKKEGGDWTYISTIEPSLATWKPQIFKAILGAVSGILTTPLYALFWLTRCGWALKNHEKHYGEQ